MKTDLRPGRILMLAFALAFPFSRADAELRDTTLLSTFKYTEELGYFQKANRDLNDPVFMLYDQDAGLSFGIGGSVRVRASFDCFGSMMTGNTKFNPGFFDIPTVASDRFDSSISGSELHVKARYQFGEHKVIAFLQFGSSTTNSVSVGQAYLSLDGFSLGLIPSFFMDLEVGYLSAGSTVTSPVNCGHTLFGYKHKFGDHWVVGAALENPDLSIPAWVAGKYGLQADNQNAPDLTMQGKYRWDSGHVQLGAVLRNIRYWSYELPLLYAAQGITGYELGYGISLSGSQKVNRMLTLSGEFVYGKGISRYMDIFNKNICDLGITTKGDDGCYRMTAIPVFHGLAGAQFYWSKKLSSTFLFSYAKCYDVAGASIPSFSRTDFNCVFDHAFMVDANFFWHISSNAYAGVETMFGHTDLREAAILPDNHGTLMRSMIAFNFMF